MTRTFTLKTLSAALLVALPLPAAAGQRVKVDAKVQVDRVGTQVHVDIPQSITRDIREALRDITRGIGQMVGEVTRDISRDISVQVNREVDRNVNWDFGRDIGREIDRDINREIGRYRYPEYQDRGNWRASVDDRQTRTIAIGPNGTLELENFSGDITVTQSSGRDVSIEFVRTSHGRTEADARAGLERVKPEVDVVGTRASVHASYTERATNYSVSTDFIVKAPAGTRVVINSLRADVRVTGIKGELKVTTASGDVVLTDVGAIQEAKTASGDVTIKGATSDEEIEAGTLNGDVTLIDIKARRITANSLNGSVVARDVVCDGATLSTIAGDVLYAGSLTKGGRYEFTSNSGDVRFSPTGSTGYALQATSFTGDITSSVELVQPASSRSLAGQRGPRRRAATAKVGDGSATVTLQTFSGDISIGKAGIK
jgi:DUF4097 and DUF4098 domain-containing protein YvlB